MITKGELKKAKTLAQVSALLAKYRSEDELTHERAKTIANEIRALRAELRTLNKKINEGVSERDILEKLGIIYDKENA